MSGAELFIREDLGLTDAQTEVLTGSMNLYMLVPILAAGWAADLLGRRGTLLLASAFLVAGALSMSLARSYAALMAARFVTSVGVGLSLVVVPVYNTEISPASTRGVLFSLLDVSILYSVHGRTPSSSAHDFEALLLVCIDGCALLVACRSLSTSASFSATCRTTRSLTCRCTSASASCTPRECCQPATGAPRRGGAGHARVTTVARDARALRARTRRAVAHLGHPGRG